MKAILALAVLTQRVLLTVTFYWFRLVTPSRKRRSIDWVVGPDETASVVHQISSAVPRTYSVCFTARDSYDFNYDYRPSALRSKRGRAWYRAVVAPVLMARLMNRALGFLYVGPSGFLIEAFDERDFELKFLKKHGLRCAIYWCGSDIRSTKKMHEIEKSMGLPNISTYIGLIVPEFETEAHEDSRRRRAMVAMKFADVMFDYPTDQSSYLTTYREPAFYFMSSDELFDHTHKFADLSSIVVIHATTSPAIKGTALVRSAVDKLRSEGYLFEYLEFVGSSHEDVVAGLARSHIALNQFYGFTTTVFGVEAMAAQCVVLASTDGSIETLLPPNVNEAIVVTKHWQVYSNLKHLLDNPALLEPIARRGQGWVRTFQSRDNTGKLMTGILDSVLDGTYDLAARSQLTIAQIYETTELTTHN